LLDTLPSLDSTVGVLQASVAVAVPSAPLISPADGLQPSDVVVPPDVSVGGVRSSIQLTTRHVVEVLPHPSFAVNVLFCEREHPLLDTLPSLDSTVGVLQASVAVAVPSAPLISPADGLQPSDVVVPPDVSVGGVISSIQFTVLDTVDVLLHPSFAVKVLVCERLHPLLTTRSSLCVTVGTPQASVAVAVPNAPLISPADGLQPSDVVVPPDVSVGGVTSSIQLTVLDTVDVLLHPSFAVKVLVCERPHPVLTTRPSLCDTVGTPHASVAVAVPNAPLISPADGLQPSDVVVPPDVSVGGVRSSIHVTVLDVVDVLPQ
jgi:hypothetical protein